MLARMLTADLLYTAHPVTPTPDHVPLGSAMQPPSRLARDDVAFSRTTARLRLHPRLASVAPGFVCTRVPFATPCWFW